MFLIFEQVLLDFEIGLYEKRVCFSCFRGLFLIFGDSDRVFGDGKHVFGACVRVFGDG